MLKQFEIQHNLFMQNLGSIIVCFGLMEPDTIVVWCCQSDGSVITFSECPSYIRDRMSLSDNMIYVKNVDSLSSLLQDLKTFNSDFV